MAPSDVDPRIPKQLQISWQRIQTEYGPVALPAESFVLPELPGEHEAVVARGSGTMTIMIPRNTAIVIAHVRAGHLTLDNYHGVFITHVRSGGISLDHVSGTGFVESMRGRIDSQRTRRSTGFAYERPPETSSSRAVLHIRFRRAASTDRSSTTTGSFNRVSRASTPSTEMWRSAFAGARRSAPTAAPDTSFRAFPTTRRYAETQTRNKRRWAVADRSLRPPQKMDRSICTAVR